MVDAYRPLHVDPNFTKVEVADYWKSWIKK
jgi:hypothetical protein